MFGDLEAFLTFFFILGVKSQFCHGQKSLESYRLDETDRSVPSGRSVDFCSKAEVIFVIFNFPDLGSMGPGPRADEPRAQGPWAPLGTSTATWELPRPGVS